MSQDISESTTQPSSRKDGDLTDLQAEMWILLPVAQTLTAFLVLIPFTGGFSEAEDDWTTIYLVTFVCALLSLVLFTAPAAHHRIHRPVLDKENYKTLSTRYMVAGMVPLTISTFAVMQLVFAVIMPTSLLAWLAAIVLALVLLAMWWVIPLWRRLTSGKP